MERCWGYSGEKNTTNTLILVLKHQAGCSVDFMSMQYLFKVLWDWGAHVIRQLGQCRQFFLNSSCLQRWVQLTSACRLLRTQMQPHSSPVVLTGRHFTRVLKRGYGPSRWVNRAEVALCFSPWKDSKEKAVEFQKCVNDRFASSSEGARTLGS